MGSRYSGSKHKVSHAFAPPPKEWGVEEWKTPDGMTARRAQVIMRAFVEYTHSVPALSSELSISEVVAEKYLDDWRTIPKGVIYRLPVLVAVLKKSPAKTRQIMRKLGEEAAYDAGQA